MKRTKRILTLALALCVLSAACLTGCTKNQTADNSWTDIETKGKIVVGMDDEFPPMGFRSTDGELVGFDIDLAKAVGEKLGLEVELKTIDWDAKELELSSGKIDLIWNGYTITPAREEKVLFTKPYLKSDQVIITKKDSGINSKKDLAGKKIGLQNGSSSLSALQKDEDTYKSIGDENISKYKSNVDALLDLEIGRTDAVIVDEVVARYHASLSKDQFVVLEDSFDSESYGIGLRLGSATLKEKVETTIASLIEEGTAIKISNTWFGSDIIER